MATKPVSQVLVTSGNQALIAAGSRPESLAIGQAGVFNWHTGLSVDGSVPADARDIYIAVGVDPNGVGTIQDIDKSAGQMIQVRNMKSLTYRGTVLNVAKIVDVFGFTAKCEEDYVLKVEFRNGQISMENGFNQFTKSWAVRTDCCADQCIDCGSGDASEIAESLVPQINADPDGLLLASYVVNAITATVAAEPTAAGTIVVTVGETAYSVAIVDADTVTTAAAKIVAVINTQADSPYRATSLLGVMTIYPKVSTDGATTTLVYTTPVAGMTITPIVAATKTNILQANIAAFVTANPGVNLGIRLTTIPLAINAYNGGINLKYVKNRNVDIIVSTPVGFTCNGTITTIQDASNEEGTGYDIKQLEYMAGGWNGRPGPYRTSAVHGLEREGIAYRASATARYNTFMFTYDQMSVGGWQEFLNNLETILAVPCADTTTTTSIAAVLDLIFTQFGAMAGDVAANDGCTNVQTSTLVAATDGIESLA